MVREREPAILVWETGGNSPSPLDSQGAGGGGAVGLALCLRLTSFNAESAPLWSRGTNTQLQISVLKARVNISPFDFF